MQLGVEHIVFDTAHLEHFAQEFRYFNRGCTYQYRTAFFYQAFDFFDYGAVLFFLGFVHAVVHVDTCNRTVGGDGNHIKFVDVPELAGLCFGCTGHTGQLVIHAEVVLQRDGGKGLCSGLDFHSFLGLDGLVQAVGVASAFHDTACLFVDNLDFVVVDNVFYVFLKQCVCLKQLGHGVYALGLYGIVLHQFVFAGLAFSGIGQVFELGKLRCYVGKHKEGWVFDFAGEFVDAFVGEFYAAVLFVDYKVEWVGDEWHLACVVLQIVCLGLEQQVFHAFLREEFD